jgi:CspA family cold shock protein
VYVSKDVFLLSMPNHGRSRQSRGRSFDDDFTYDRAPSTEGPRYPAPSGMPTGFGPELKASVKWFNPEKGFGFVELSDGSGDVFLHVNALSGAGHSTVSPGATLSIRVGQGQKGRQVSEVISVDESTATQSTRGPRPQSGQRRPDLGPGVEMRGTVKMYNSTKGFGFVALPEGGKDVFVHASALQRGGIGGLTEGQTVWVEVVQGAKGPEAVSVRMA